MDTVTLNIVYNREETYIILLYKNIKHHFALSKSDKNVFCYFILFLGNRI